MSFEAKVQCVAPNIETIERAGRVCLFEFDRTATTYKAHEGGRRCQGKLVRADHAAGAYEIGVTPRTDGQPGYNLAYDPWSRGGDLVHELAGENLSRLQNEIGVDVATAELEALGCSVARQLLPDGSIELTGTRLTEGEDHVSLAMS